MSTHKECGEPIRWARNSNGTKWLPPLELIGDVIILIKSEEGDGEYIASEVSGYRVHHCDPDKVLAWREYKDKIAKIDNAQREEAIEQVRSDREIARLRDMENSWAVVSEIACPKCAAPAQSKCVNLSKAREGGEVVFTKWPHPERVEEAENG